MKKGLNERPPNPACCFEAGSSKHRMLLPRYMLFQPALKRPPVVDNPCLTMQVTGQALLEDASLIPTKVSAARVGRTQRGISSAS